MIGKKLTEHPVNKSMFKYFEQISPIFFVCFTTNTEHTFLCSLSIYQFQFSSNRETRITSVDVNLMTSQLIFTCSKSATETLKHGVKCVQS